jgi:phosphonate transport system substrate-binding protein
MLVGEPMTLRPFPCVNALIRLYLVLLLVLGLRPVVWAGALLETSTGPLRIGVFPRRDAAVTMRMFKPLARYLQQALGRPVVLETSANYDDFAIKLAQGRYDLVHLNQYHYVRARQVPGYNVLAQNEEFGEPSIRAAIYVRKDSGIDELAQLKGKVILFGGDRRAMMSYVVPTFLLRQAGLHPGDYREYFAASPPNAVLATYLGRVAASGAGEVVRRLPLVTGKIDPDALKLLAVSQPLAHLPWAARGDMPAPLQARLRSLLLGLKHTDEGRKVLKAARLTGLNPAADSDYDPHREIILSLEGSQP